MRKRKAFLAVGLTTLAPVLASVGATRRKERAMRTICIVALLLIVPLTSCGSSLRRSGSRKILGNWLDETPRMEKWVTLFEQDGTVFMERIYKDGSRIPGGKKEMIETFDLRGRKFHRKEGRRFGEYCLIDSQGNLQIWDEEGIISTAKKTD